MSKVELKHVTKYFSDPDAAGLVGRKGRPALDGVSLTIHDGETLSVVGPSGCGKSTLLKVIAGLEYPDEGQILYDEQDFTDVRPKDRGAGPASTLVLCPA
jgi:ABC-type sugar transport system ATPase subunit